MRIQKTIQISYTKTLQSLSRITRTSTLIATILASNSQTLAQESSQNHENNTTITSIEKNKPSSLNTLRTEGELKKIQNGRGKDVLAHHLFQAVVISELKNQKTPLSKEQIQDIIHKWQEKANVVQKIWSGNMPNGSSHHEYIKDGEALIDAATKLIPKKIQKVQEYLPKKLTAIKGIFKRITERGATHLDNKEVIELQTHYKNLLTELDAETIKNSFDQIIALEKIHPNLSNFRIHMGVFTPEQEKILHEISTTEDNFHQLEKIKTVFENEKKKQKLEAFEEYKHNAQVNFLYGISWVANSLSNLSDSPNTQKSLQVFATVTNASTNIYDIHRQIKKLSNNGEDIALMQSTLTLNYVQLGLTLMQMFGNKKNIESAELQYAKAIYEQIHALQKQIEELSTQMHARFDKQDLFLEEILKHVEQIVTTGKINQNFSKNILQKITSIEKSLHIYHNKTIWSIKDVKDESLEDWKDDVLENKRSNIAELITAIRNKWSKHAYNKARDTDNINSQTDGTLLNALQEDPLEILDTIFAETEAITDFQNIQDAKSFPNMQEWIRAVKMLNELSLKKTDDFYTNLQEKDIKKLQEEFTHFEDKWKKLFSHRNSENKGVFHEILNSYTKDIENLWHFISQQRISLLYKEWFKWSDWVYTQPIDAGKYLTHWTHSNNLAPYEESPNMDSRIVRDDLYPDHTKFGKWTNHAAPSYPKGMHKYADGWDLLSGHIGTSKIAYYDHINKIIYGHNRIMEKKDRYEYRSGRRDGYVKVGTDNIHVATDITAFIGHAFRIQHIFPSTWGKQIKILSPFHKPILANNYLTVRMQHSRGGTALNHSHPISEAFDLEKATEKEGIFIVGWYDQSYKHMYQDCISRVWNDITNPPISIGGKTYTDKEFIKHKIHQKFYTLRLKHIENILNVLDGNDAQFPYTGDYDIQKTIFNIAKKKRLLQQLYRLGFTNINNPVIEAWIPNLLWKSDIHNLYQTALGNLKKNQDITNNPEIYNQLQAFESSIGHIEKRIGKDIHKTYKPQTWLPEILLSQEAIKQIESITPSVPQELLETKQTLASMQTKLKDFGEAQTSKNNTLLLVILIIALTGGWGYIYKSKKESTKKDT